MNAEAPFDVLLPEQRALAVYKNNFGQAVLRVERYWDEESDPYIVIDHAHLPTVIAALRVIADEQADRAPPDTSPKEGPVLQLRGPADK